MNEPIRCVCGHTLGVRDASGQVVSAHRGREWAGQPSYIRCEKCSAVWRPAVVVESFLSIRARREAGREERERLRRLAQA